jgi:pimeloyl-ACP methyl ester carboxylesterase
MTDNQLFAWLATVAALASGANGASAQQAAVAKHQSLQSGSGAPVVVFESGLGETLDTWRAVQKNVSAFTESFSYNRAGYAGSSRATGTRDAATAVNELRELLAARGLAPPYVLVGHSLGGLYMQYFARNFPDEVAGLVLVDSTHWGGELSERMRREAPEVAALDASQRRNIPSGILAEADALETSGREVRESPPLRPMLLTVISAGMFRPPPETRAAQGATLAKLKGEMQRELAAQLPDARWLIAERSDHFVQLEQPELVVAAVRDIVEALRRQ